MSPKDTRPDCLETVGEPTRIRLVRHLGRRR